MHHPADYSAERQDEACGVRPVAGAARWALLAAVALLGACAQVPVGPAPVQDNTPFVTIRRPPDWESARDTAIANHRKLAQQYKSSGDIADAETQWQIVTALAPEDAAARKELDAARAAVKRGIADNLQAGNAAHRSGDNDRATQAMLRVLALDPDNADAAKTLRDIDRQKMARTQADRAAKFKLDDAAPAARSTPNAAAEPADGYDLEQRLEMFRAGDTAGGMRELRAYVEANPKNRAARQRIAAAVYERGIELENKGSREQAVGLYEQAVAFRGDTPPQWATRIQAARKALSNEYYDMGTRSYRTDIALAIKQWETSVRYDPNNLKASERLREAKLAQEKLDKIGAPRK